MGTKSEKKTATYIDLGKLEFEGGGILTWNNLDVPYGTKVEIVIKYEQGEYLHGANGIVWATHYFDQAEMIKAALNAQNIDAEIIRETLTTPALYLLKVTDSSRIRPAIDYIWRSDEGLKLQPDWHYPAGQPNASVDRWTKAT